MVYKISCGYILTRSMYWLLIINKNWHVCVNLAQIVAYLTAVVWLSHWCKPTVKSLTWTPSLGMSDLDYNWARLSPNGTNMGLLNICFLFQNEQMSGLLPVLLLSGTGIAGSLFRTFDKFLNTSICSWFLLHIAVINSVIQYWSRIHIQIEANSSKNVSQWFLPLFDHIYSSSSRLQTFTESSPVHTSIQILSHIG